MERKDNKDSEKSDCDLVIIDTCYGIGYEDCHENA